MNKKWHRVSVQLSGDVYVEVPEDITDSFTIEEIVYENFDEPLFSSMGVVDLSSRYEEETVHPSQFSGIQTIDLDDYDPDDYREENADT